MRVTYRSHGGSREYWEQRWAQIPADAGQLNLERYPGRFAEMIMRRVDGPVLEAGCGAGRVLLHYHRLGRSITGIDYVRTAVDKINALDPTVRAEQADIANLPFDDGQFAAVLAFGLYHSLERDADKALAETRRVLRHGGLLCASVRMDNIQNRINDWLADRNDRSGGPRQFHKANFTTREFDALLRQAGFEPERTEYVENMPLMYKFRPFRHPTHRAFNEHVARGEGYRLSRLGNAVQRSLIATLPRSFCNIMVATARVR